jgi:hypothetical protein
LSFSSLIIGVNLKIAPEQSGNHDDVTLLPKNVEVYKKTHVREIFER